MEPAEYLEYPEMPEPSCVNCGFLGHQREETRGGIPAKWLIAGEYERTSGDFRSLGTVLPQCWMRAASIPHEIEALADITPRDASRLPGQAVPEFVRSIINRQRDECHRYQPWTPHWSVEQHLEEHKVHLQEKQRREWERSVTGHWLPLAVAVAAIIVSATASLWGSHIEAQATLDAAHDQIKAQQRSTAPVSVPTGSVR
jgi:hypothetical protein